MKTLNSIKSDYSLPLEFYGRLKLAINSNENKDIDDENKFINCLPDQLKVELSVYLYRNMLDNIKFL